MIAHLFKLIWNRKKQNFLLMLEMFVSFIVMFGVFTLCVNYYLNYRKTRGFEYRDVWAVNYGLPPEVKNADSVRLLLGSLKSLIASQPQVHNLTFTGGNIPYSNNTYNTSIGYQEKDMMSHIYTADLMYPRVLGIEMESGEWKADERGGKAGIVINSTLKQNLFGNDRAEGKEIKIDNELFKVSGVVKDFKSAGDYQAVENGIFKIPDTIERGQDLIMLKVKPGTDASFEARLHKIVSGFSRNTTVEVEHLEKKRTAKNNMTLIPMLIFLLVSAFLIINVALGLFGVLWYNISRRKGEIGLRRAIGASSGSISWQVSGETLSIATISVLVGVFFAVQFPLLNVFDMASNVYFTAIVLSVIFMYLLVLVCSLYPARQASAIDPAIALHEE